MKEHIAVNNTDDIFIGLLGAKQHELIIGINYYGDPKQRLVKIIDVKSSHSNVLDTEIALHKTDLGGCSLERCHIFLGEIEKIQCYNIRFDDPAFANRSVEDQPNDNGNSKSLIPPSKMDLIKN